MRSLRLTALATAAMCSSLFIIRCSNTPEEQRDKMNDKMEKIDEKMDDASKADTKQEWVEEKNSVARDLRDLQVSIDEKLSKADEKLTAPDIKADERTKQEALRVELKKEKEVVTTQLANVEGATDATWNTVKGDARKSMDDIKAWWDKQDEKIDQKTTSDKDNDGH